MTDNIAQGLEMILGVSAGMWMIVFYCREPRSLADILSYKGNSDRTKFRNKYIKLLLQQGRIRMTLPDMPTSKRQKYVASEKTS